MKGTRSPKKAEAGRVAKGEVKGEFYKDGICRHGENEIRKCKETHPELSNSLIAINPCRS